MSKKEEYIGQISLRGDQYGNNGGTNSLLEWCAKNSLQAVTEEEARIFFENPQMDYKSYLQQSHHDAKENG